MRCTKCRALLPSGLRQQGKRFLAIHGSSETELRTIEDESIDFILTDPPYGTGANSTSGRLLPSSKKYQSSDAQKLFPEIENDNLMPEAWQFLMTDVLRQLFRVAKPGTHLLLFCDWRSMGSFSQLAAICRWHVRSVAVWDKGRASRPFPNGFRNQSEFILWAKKPGGADERPTPNSVYLDGVFSFPKVKQTERQHMTQKPVPLLKELLRLAPKEARVLDPFQGAGSTGVAAMEMGHRFIGIESSRRYHPIAVDRLQAAEKSSTD